MCTKDRGETKSVLPSEKREMWSRHHHLAQHLRQVLPCEAKVFRLAHTSASRKQNERLQTSSSSLSKGLSIQHERHEHQGMSQRCQRSEHYQTTKHILSIEGSCQLSSCAQPAELCQPSVFSWDETGMASPTPPKRSGDTLLSDQQKMQQGDNGSWVHVIHLVRRTP